MATGISIESMKSHGFTIIELLVVTAVLAILATVAVPSMRDAIHRQRTVDVANSLVASLHFARSEAARRNVVVSVCRSLDPSADDQLGLACLDNAVGTVGVGDWGVGWVVFARTGAVDPTDANPAVFEIGDTVLRRVVLDPGGASRSFVTSTTAADPISFRGDGTRIGGTAVFAIEHRGLDRPASAVTRCIRIEGSSSPRVSRSISGAC